MEHNREIELNEESLTLTIEEEEIEAQERNEQDWFMLGVNAYVHEAYEEALNCFDRILDKDPYNARVYVNRGDVYADCGDYEEAFNDYAMAIHLGSTQAVEMRDDLIRHVLENKIMTAEELAKMTPKD